MLTPYQRFLFDLNGFLVLRGVVSKQDVAAMVSAIDKQLKSAADSVQSTADSASWARARASNSLRNTKQNTTMSAQNPRIDIGGMLGWTGEDGRAFRKLLAHPNLVPYLNELCGAGYRLDHQPLCIVNDRESEGFLLHGGPRVPGKKTRSAPRPGQSGDDGTVAQANMGEVDTGSASQWLQYKCDSKDGKLWNSLLAVSVALSKVDNSGGNGNIIGGGGEAGTSSDSGVFDGGFCILPGSHKLNFPVPDAFANGEADVLEDFKRAIHVPSLDEGDSSVTLLFELVVAPAFLNTQNNAISLPNTGTVKVVLFSEATVHGALPWRNVDLQRKLALYRFAPPGFGYGRGYLGKSLNTENEAVSKSDASKSDDTGAFGIPTSALKSEFSEAELSVLEPPYSNRLERSELVVHTEAKGEAGEGVVELKKLERSKEKKDHDERIFGTQYF